MRAKTRIDDATPLGVGVTLGISVGAVMGIVGGPVGALIGLIVGTIAGVVSGVAMRRDEGRRAARSSELDRIIGVAEGDLGAAPVAMPRDDGDEQEQSREAWVAEWLTPPPPVAS